MAREFAESFYKSQAWINTRNAYRSSVKGLCEHCLKAGLIKPGVIVHHRVHLTPENINDPTVTLSFKNLKLVCMECHAKEHSNSGRFFFDFNGGIIEK